MWLTRKKQCGGEVYDSVDVLYPDLFDAIPAPKFEYLFDTRDTLASLYLSNADSIRVWVGILLCKLLCVTKTTRNDRCIGIRVDVHRVLFELGCACFRACERRIQFFGTLFNVLSVSSDYNNGACRQMA